MHYTLIGDIHSAADDLAVLLQAAALKNNRLIFLGDYIDGNATRTGSSQPDALAPLAVLDLVMARVQQHHDIALLGNHDDFWLQTAAGDDLSYQTWRLNGGARTWRQLGIHSNRPLVIAAELNRSSFARYTKFLAQLPLTWQTDHILAMHAGLDWRYPLDQQVRDDILWIRDDYYYDDQQQWHRNLTNKVIVTGHTPVQTMTDTGVGFIKMQADAHDIPRYVIDGGSRSGAEDGGISALTLDEQGNVVAMHRVIQQQLLEVL